MSEFWLHQGDCLDVLRGLPDSSIDSIVTDPPYGLSFMGKKWDYDVPGVDVWAECLRVLKPGGHLLAFAGTRTQHRMAVRIEDAGFEIRDMIAWVYGSGFPKSLDVSKAIDKAAGVEREVIGQKMRCDGKSAGLIKPMNGGAFSSNQNKTAAVVMDTAPATEAAKQWQGWGSALKPALEPVTVARKPLIGTIAENVLVHGTGAINVDGCRVATDDKLGGGHSTSGQQMTDGWERPWMKDPEAVAANAERSRQSVAKSEALGRWPANLIHNGSDEVVRLFPKTGPSNTRPPTGKPLFAGAGRSVEWNQNSVMDTTVRGVSDTGGSAARFFYCAKASKSDRDEGLDGFEAKATAFGNQAQAELKRGNMDHGDGKSGMNKVKMRANTHPTVKPTDLMAYLCRLVTPPGGTVLDPFMGSGSTGKAAMIEGFDFIGIEREAEYLEIARARITAQRDQPATQDMFEIPASSFLATQSPDQPETPDLFA